MCGAVAWCDGSTHLPCMCSCSPSVRALSRSVSRGLPASPAHGRPPAMTGQTPVSRRPPSERSPPRGEQLLAMAISVTPKGKGITSDPWSSQGTQTSSGKGRQWLESLSTIALYARKAWKHRSPAERALARRRGPLPSLGYSAPAWRPAYWSHPTRHPSGTLASQSGRVDRTLFRKAGTMPCMQGRVVTRLTQDR